MSKKITDKKDTLHFLTEMRVRLIRSFIVLFVLLTGFLFFANQLYTLIALPLLKFLPQGQLIATQITSPFFVPFKLAMIAAFLCATPFFLAQIWGFVAPALYPNERRVLWPFLIASILLFYTGIAFAYLFIFPALFHFLAKIAPVGVQFMPDISEYLDFALTLLFTFGALFEIPMVMVVLVLTRVVSRGRFLRLRSYAIVSAFIIAMLLAPPDVFSQTLLAIPIWGLYELGLFLTRFIEPRAKINETENHSA